jgi:hypothetical protein
MCVKNLRRYILVFMVVFIRVRLGVFENRELRKEFGSKRDE